MYKLKYSKYKNKNNLQSGGYININVKLTTKSNEQKNYIIKLLNEDIDSVQDNDWRFVLHNFCIENINNDPESSELKQLICQYHSDSILDDYYDISMTNNMIELIEKKNNNSEIIRFVYNIDCRNDDLFNGILEVEIPNDIQNYIKENIVKNAFFQMFEKNTSLKKEYEPNPLFLYGMECEFEFIINFEKKSYAYLFII
jgi:hypothetical protein